MKRAITSEVIARFKVEGVYVKNRIFHIYFGKDRVIRMKKEELIGTCVIHGSYGRGVILECTDNHIKVEFSDLNKISTFLYPECFVKHLVFEHQKIQEEMQAYLKIWKSESGYAAKEKLWKQYQKVQSGIIARRKAAEEKKRLAAERTFANRMNSKFNTFPKKNKENI